MHTISSPADHKCCSATGKTTKKKGDSMKDSCYLAIIFLFVTHPGNGFQHSLVGQRIRSSNLPDERFGPLRAEASNRFNNNEKNYVKGSWWMWWSSDGKSDDADRVKWYQIVKTENTVLPIGWRLADLGEARSQQKTIVNLLNHYDICMLDNGYKIDGPRYGGKILRQLDGEEFGCYIMTYANSFYEAGQMAGAAKNYGSWE